MKPSCYFIIFVLLTVSVGMLSAMEDGVVPTPLRLAQLEVLDDPSRPICSRCGELITQVLFVELACGHFLDQDCFDVWCKENTFQCPLCLQIDYLYAIQQLLDDKFPPPPSVLGIHAAGNFPVDPQAISFEERLNLIEAYLEQDPNILRAADWQARTLLFYALDFMLEACSDPETDEECARFMFLRTVILT